MRALSRALLSGFAILALAASGIWAQSRDRSEQPSDRAWLGLYIRNLDRDDQRALDLDRGAEGVVVSGVDDEGPAARAGLEPGDLITQLDGQPVRDQRAFVRAVQEHKSNDRVRLSYVRGGRTRSVEVQLELRAANADSTSPDVRKRDRRETPEAGNRYGSPWSQRRALGFRPRLGVEVMDLSDADLASYFGVRAGTGVLVTRVTDGSGAEKAGMKAGDVILRVQDRNVSSVAELQDAVAQRDSGDTVELVVQRSNHEKRLRVEVGSPGPLSLNFGTPGLAALGRMPGFDNNDVEQLRRELRDLRRQVDDLQSEMRTLRRR